MLNMKKGCRVITADKLYEQYEKTEYGYIANVNVEKIVEMLKTFISVQEGLVFFFLEIPSNLNDENEIRTGVLDSTHKDIYYMDSLNKEEAFRILDTSGELLANDGLTSFGFGLQNTGDEIGVGKYNIVTIFAQGNNSYDDLFGKFDITETKKLVTAWDTFTSETLGRSEKISIDGKDVYSFIEDFKAWGLYFAERREDN